MAFDGIITNIVVGELNKLLISARVEKIYMPTKNDIIIVFHSTNRTNYKLYISIDPSNARFHITNVSKENPAIAPQFCMILRKYIQGAKLTSIEQFGLDRVVLLQFENINELGDLTNYSLYIELMGKYSNIILVNDSQKIIDSIKRVDSSMSSIREVLPNREYILPTTLGKEEFLGMNYQTFINALQTASLDPYFSMETLSKIVANQFIGFSKVFIDNLLEYSNFDGKFTHDVTQAIFNYINLIIFNSPNHLLHLMRFENDYHVDLRDFSTTINLTEISSFLDDYYVRKEELALLKNTKINLIKDVNSFKSKYQKNLKRVNEIIEDGKNLEKYKLYGELITANIYKLQGGEKELIAENYYDNNTLITIPLNETVSPSKNSQNYFKKYSKLKTAVSHATEQKADYESNIDYLDSVIYSINEASDIVELALIKDELSSAGFKNYSKNKKKYHDDVALGPYRYEYDGIEILAGRNNIQNDKLTLKESKKTHTWLHVKDSHGSHVVVKSDSPSNKVLEYAATIAKKHSEAKDSSKVSVDYTLVKFVHKPAGSKPGKVIYTDYKTIVIS